MSSVYKCGTCGVISNQQDHLCQPGEMASSDDFCGSGPENISQLCDSMSENLRYQCYNCGRPSENPNLLCQPHSVR